MMKRWRSAWPRMEMCTDAETILRALEPESGFPALDCYSFAVVWHLCSPSDQSEEEPESSCLSG